MFTKKWSTSHKFKGKTSRKNETRGRKKKHLSEGESQIEAVMQAENTAHHDVVEASTTSNTTTSSKKINFYKNIELNNILDNNNSNNNNNNNKFEDILEALETKTTKVGVGKYAIIHVEKLNQLLKKSKCQNCQTNTTYIEHGRQLGLAVDLKLYCNSCQCLLASTMSSPQITTDSENNNSRLPYEINHRVVIAMKEIGAGEAALNKITGIMDISGGIHHKTYSQISHHLHSSLVYNTTCEVLSDAHIIVRKAYEDINPDLKSETTLNIAVSFDAAWHRRGHNSNYGIGFIIDSLTGLIIDYDILSKYCYECEIVGKHLNGEDRNIWEKTHKMNCDRNWTGSSNAMESGISQILWKRSIDVAGFRYTTVISDGDCAMYGDLLKLDPYGKDYPITKEECLNHVQKRMYTGLERMCKDMTSKGVTMRGRGRMTADRMLKWQSYYRNAIKNNSGNIKKMKDDIWSILFHATSTMENPHHARCGDWCYYQAALKDGKDPADAFKEKKHDPPLPREVSETLIPLFQRLSDDKLLERCQKNCTQNANESLHAFVWRKVPKTVFVSKKTLETGAALAVCEFNKGYSALTDIIKNIGIEPGKKTETLSTALDHARLAKAKRKSEETIKVARKTKKLVKAREEETLQQKEGVTYNAGGF